MSTAPSITEDLRAGLTRTIANAVAREAQRHACDVFSDEVLTALAKGLVPFLREFVATALRPLEARVAELEQAPTMKYCGVWEPERSYSVGDFVTQEGSMWHCEVPCTGVRPPASTWTLCVKRGRDGKDAK